VRVLPTNNFEYRIAIQGFKHVIEGIKESEMKDGLSGIEREQLECLQERASASRELDHRIYPGKGV